MLFAACHSSERRSAPVPSESRDDVAVAPADSGAVVLESAGAVDSDAAANPAATTAGGALAVDAGRKRSQYAYFFAKDGGIDGKYVPDVVGTLDCFKEYYGAGTRRDWPRARACFARDVEAVGPCGGDVFLDLPRLFLAVMESEGQGGPVMRPEALALLDGCDEQDGTLLDLRDAARGLRSLSQDGGPPDPCLDVMQTTFSMAQCVHMRKAIHDRLPSDPR
jgi:hypothetical protein